MRTVSRDSMLRAMSILRDIIPGNIDFEQIPEQFRHYVGFEMYPQIFYSHDEKVAHRRLEGSGVSLFAFLLEESAKTRTRSLCVDCTKRFCCELELPTTSMPALDTDDGNDYGASDYRDQALDYLQFLRTKYPDVYIPLYSVIGDDGIERDWADLLIHIEMLKIGIVAVDYECADFEHKVK